MSCGNDALYIRKRGGRREMRKRDQRKNDPRASLVGGYRGRVLLLKETEVIGLVPDVWRDDARDPSRV